MEKFPEMTQRFPAEIRIQNYMRDHRFAGRTVLPAVESCSILSQIIISHFPHLNARDIYNASFDKFIEIKPDEDIIPAFIDAALIDDGSVVLKLVTKTKSKSGITRTNEHVTLQYKKNMDPYKELTYDVASAPDGICTRLSSDAIYKDLVTFGPAFHNVKVLFATEKTITAEIIAPQHGEGPLGCPLVFDAALHAANIWGQIYRDTVAYPIGFERRIILKPAIPGEKYFSKIIPTETEQNNLIFDIWIFDSEGSLSEAGFGVKIKDVTSGEIKPVQWIKNKNNNPLKKISGLCDAFSVIELDALAPYSVKALSDKELQRMGTMVPKRAASYTGARIACKFLTRKLSKDASIPANQITTISEKIYPCCPIPDSATPYKCSVSHDSRFAVAVASRKRIGIDVEKISERVLYSQRIYMCAEESSIADSAGMSELEACLRIWSIKEAVTKAFGISLSESWKAACVNYIGKDTSTFLIDGAEIKAYHATIDVHLFTVVVV